MARGSVVKGLTWMKSLVLAETQFKCCVNPQSNFQYSGGGYIAHHKCVLVASQVLPVGEDYHHPRVKPSPMLLQSKNEQKIFLPGGGGDGVHHPTPMSL